MSKITDSRPGGRNSSSAIPRVSIGLPVRNGAPFLREAVDSLLSQTFSDFELIICDNASDDGTVDIALEYLQADSRVRYFRNDHDLGAARNFNKTFALSRGEYFKWAACDDIHLPDYLARCVQALDADPSVVLAYPKASEINENGTVRKPLFDSLELSYPSAALRFHRLLWDQRNPHMIFGLTRARALAQTGLFRAEKGADRLLLAQLALLGPWHQVDEMLFVNRRTNSVRRGRSRQWWDPSLRDYVVLRRLWLKFREMRAVHACALPAAQKVLLSIDVLGCYIVRDLGIGAREVRWTVLAWLRRMTTASSARS